MKRVFPLSLGLLVTLALASPSRAETALGAVFGYPGNIGFSARFDQTAIGVAWSSDFLHGTFDRWMIQKKMKEGDGKLSWYFGPGGDVGIPLDDGEDFFLAARAPIGLQLMVRPKIEGFAEFAPGIQLVDDVKGYWAGSVGVRWVLGGK
jgi:hypothetical protein